MREIGGGAGGIHRTQFESRSWRNERTTKAKGGKRAHAASPPEAASCAAALRSHRKAKGHVVECAYQEDEEQQGDTSSTHDTGDLRDGGC